MGEVATWRHCCIFLLLAPLLSTTTVQDAFHRAKAVWRERSSGRMTATATAFFFFLFNALEESSAHLLVARHKWSRALQHSDEYVYALGEGYEEKGVLETEALNESYRIFHVVNTSRFRAVGNKFLPLKFEYGPTSLPFLTLSRCILSPNFLHPLNTY